MRGNAHCACGDCWTRCARLLSSTRLLSAIILCSYPTIAGTGPFIAQPGVMRAACCVNRSQQRPLIGEIPRTRETQASRRAGLVGIGYIILYNSGRGQERKHGQAPRTDHLIQQTFSNYYYRAGRNECAGSLAVEVYRAVIRRVKRTPYPRRFFYCCLSDLPRILEKQKYDRETVPTIADERRRRSTCAEQRLDRGQHFEEAFHAYVTHARMR